MSESFHSDGFKWASDSARKKRAFVLDAISQGRITVSKDRNAIPAMSPVAVDLVRRMESVVRSLPQAPFKLDNLLHAGMYARTVTLPPGLWTGALVKAPTILIVIGDATVYIGEDEPLHVSGVTVLAAGAGRKQAFLTQGCTTLIMIAVCDAETVPEAEAALTDETALLRTGE